MQAEIPLRETLLRTRRYGEQDQGVPTRSLCRSHLDRHDAGKPAAPMVGVVRLHSALRRAPDRAASHDVFQGKLRHYPSQATQDRRSGSCQRPAHQICHGLKLSSCRCVGPCRQPSQRRCEPARLARVTRAAAARNNRGITPGPPRSNRSLHPQPRKSPSSCSRPPTPRASTSRKRESTRRANPGIVQR